MLGRNTKTLNLCTDA